MGDYIVNLKDVAMGDVAQVGGKNASLGEMINHLSGMGVDVPGGFATTAEDLPEASLRSLRVFDRAWSKQNSRACGH